jgi:hypothetical protein
LKLPRGETGWNICSPETGEWMVWAGTLVSFESGTRVALTWDKEASHWCPCWVDRQLPCDEYETWGWYAEWRLGGETKVVTP